MTTSTRSAAPGKICYLLKRFPRLSETFILNEVLALERLGARLVIISLLPREEVMAHSTVRDVKAPIHYLPSTWRDLLTVAARAHAGILRRTPLSYLKAVGQTVWWGMKSRSPVTTVKKFCRAAITAEICARENVRHIHAHFANTPTGVAEVVRVMCRLPYSFTTHAKDLYLTQPSLIARRIGSAKFAVTCTQYNADYIRSFLSDTEKHKVHLVYHGIDLDRFFHYFDADLVGHGPAEARVPVILSVGRLVPKKGMRDLVSACALLRDHGVAFRCLIVGKGPLRDELQAQIDTLGLHDEVELLGAMAHEELLSFYAKATVFALVPQITQDGDRDGIPNVLVEAMAAKLPIVTTAISGIPEIVTHGKTGFLVQPTDAEGTAAALQRLLQDQGLRHAISISAHAQLKSRFHCWESTKAIHELLLGQTAA